MNSAALKSEIDRLLADRFKNFSRPSEPLSEFVPSGIPEIDSIAGGLPRGAIAELIGPQSSGRTSLLLSMLSESTRRQELCALVDLNDTFDTEAAAGMKIDLDRLLWIRCSSNVAHALKATELLLHSAGFSIVALDMGDLSAKQRGHVPSSSWFRFRRVVENSPTTLLVIEQEPSARTCASLILETNREHAKWSVAAGPDTPDSSGEMPVILGGLRLRIERQKPISSRERRTNFEITH